VVREEPSEIADFFKRCIVRLHPLVYCKIWQIWHFIIFVNSRVGYDVSLININLRLCNVGENLLIVGNGGRSGLLFKLLPIFGQRMNLPPLPINKKLQKLSETYPLLDLSAQIIGVHPCT
jgi:hypothetical protein